jgi:predicted MFS family arabinose efflux permease
MATSAVAPQRTSWAPVMALGLAMLVVTSEMTIAAVSRVLAALAPTFWLVVVGRLLQGAAGALVVLFVPVRAR